MTERIAAATAAGLRGYSPGMAELSMLEGVREVPRTHWDALTVEDSPFLDWDWLASLEEAGCLGPESGWAAHPLVVREGERLVAACPLYVKGNSEGEFVFDWGWADAAGRAGIDYYPKLLVAVPFTPVSGGRLLTAPGEERAGWLATLAPALREICSRNALSGVHVNFCRDDERAALERAGFLPRLGLQYHWFNHGYESFEDYLGHLRSKRRNQARRELRAVREAGIAVETFVGDEIPEPLFPQLYRLYLSTIEKKYWGRQYLNDRFFELLRERFRDRLCIVAARRGDELLGGAINVQKGDALYGRYWGALADVRYLHFVVCYYAGIEHCIRHGLTRFEPGAGGDYKQLRGFDATATWSAHFLSDRPLRDAVARFLEQERSEASDAIAWIRERSALKPAGR
jgi:predicted N-acyltransferase